MSFDLTNDLTDKDNDQSSTYAFDMTTEKCDNALRQQKEQNRIFLGGGVQMPAHIPGMIGQTDALKKISFLIKQVAYTDSTVMILGETGTGKELAARAIHLSSPRKKMPMVKVNCAALPQNLIESELFGHEKGSFTGALERRIGKFELAHNSTLFLDEIGELPLELQGKLLRALQEKEIERIGGKATIKVDIRIIAATNRDLENEVASGRFREDLFYRLNIFPISLPALRHRLHDIELLARHFINHYSIRFNKQINYISESALMSLQAYDWPGNVRQLEHLIERSVLLAESETIENITLPQPKVRTSNALNTGGDKVKTIQENEREHILAILRLCHGRINGENGAAMMLGVPPSTLASKMKKLSIGKEHTVFFQTLLSR